MPEITTIISQVFFQEDDLLPIRYVGDIIFCPRRTALHLIECIWEDSIFTIEGTHLHDKVHEEDNTESRGDIRIARGLRLRSLRLGLTGIADVIEFHKESVISEKRGVVGEMPENSAFPIPHSAIALPGVSGLWRPFIVEYKRGRLRHEKSFEVQLCAQALCLEEMLNVHVPEGAVFYGKPRRRLDVAFTPGLRMETEIAAARLQELFNSGRTPTAVYEKKCESCSLMPVCMPKTMNGRRMVDRYIKDNIQT